ncbi:hypothetical protein SNEBB_011153 [Seison nebaliae]|nr:hypothetical protein SNEBB_011153 [Seison nebaliae]
MFESLNIKFHADHGRLIWKDVSQFFEKEIDNIFKFFRDERKQNIISEEQLQNLKRFNGMKRSDVKRKTNTSCFSPHGQLFAWSIEGEDNVYVRDTISRRMHYIKSLLPQKASSLSFSQSPTINKSISSIDCWFKEQMNYGTNELMENLDDNSNNLPTIIDDDGKFNIKFNDQEMRNDGDMENSMEQDQFTPSTMVSYAERKMNKFESLVQYDKRGRKIEQELMNQTDIDGNIPINQINNNMKNGNELNENISIKVKTVSDQNDDDDDNDDGGEVFAEQKKRSSSFMNPDLSSDLLLAVGTENGQIKVFQAVTGKLLFLLNDHRRRITCLSFASFHSAKLASCSEDHTVKIWNLLKDGNMSPTLTGHLSAVRSCVWSPNDSLLASGGDDHQINVWDMIEEKLYTKLSGHHNRVTSVKFSDDGSLLLSGSYDSYIIVWSIFQKIALKKFSHISPPPSLMYAGGENGAYVRQVSFTPDGIHIASIGDDCSMRIWSLYSDEKCVGEMKIDSRPYSICLRHCPTIDESHHQQQHPHELSNLNDSSIYQSNHSLSLLSKMKGVNSILQYLIGIDGGHFDLSVIQDNLQLLRWMNFTDFLSTCLIEKWNKQIRDNSILTFVNDEDEQNFTIHLRQQLDELRSRWIRLTTIMATGLIYCGKDTGDISLYKCNVWNQSPPSLMSLCRRMCLRTILQLIHLKRRRDKDDELSGSRHRLFSRSSSVDLYGMQENEMKPLIDDMALKFFKISQSITNHHHQNGNVKTIPKRVKKKQLFDLNLFDQSHFSNQSEKETLFAKVIHAAFSKKNEQLGHVFAFHKTPSSTLLFNRKCHKSNHLSTGLVPSDEVCVIDEGEEALKVIFQLPLPDALKLYLVYNDIIQSSKGIEY